MKTIEGPLVAIGPDIMNIQTKLMDWLCKHVILTASNKSTAATNNIPLSPLKGKISNVDLAIQCCNGME